MQAGGPEPKPREPVRRYEWPCPGDLLHVDWTTLARFEEPGHAVTGDRTSSAARKRRKLGYDVSARAPRRPFVAGLLLNDIVGR
jgi:hypothetical protein